MKVGGIVGQQTYSGAGESTLRLDALGDTVVSELHGKYYLQSKNKNLFLATAIVTAPVIFSTAAGTGGPLIWNGSADKNVVILAMTAAVTTASTVAGGLGLTGNTGQVSAPTSTTAIDSRSNCFIGGAASVSTPYRVGTPVNAGGFFFPVYEVGTGALTVATNAPDWVEIGGAIVCPPNGWVSVAGSATLTTAVIQIGLIYEEVPV